MRSIDLNADLGEHDGSAASSDAAMLDIVSSASIACGAHAGSLEVMTLTVKAALERGVSVGAHPSYPDREGFGRREIEMPVEKIVESVHEQIALLDHVCAEVGARLAYVKPHGALYNRAARDEKLASDLARCIKSISPELILLALSGSAMQKAGEAQGIRVAREAFIDRAYMSDGTLVDRSTPGAVITDAAVAAARALEMARSGTVRAIDGKPVSVPADSLCVHGDSRYAVEIVSAARRRLEASGFTVAPFAM